jgi:hypothetical protein
MSQVLARYADIRQRLSSGILRSRVSCADEEEDLSLRLSRQAGYLKYTLLFVPPIPNPVRECCYIPILF